MSGNNVSVISYQWEEEPPLELGRALQQELQVHPVDIQIREEHKEQEVQDPGCEGFLGTLEPGLQAGSHVVQSRRR